MPIASALAETTDIPAEERLDTYRYPNEWARVADRPAARRDASRLLVYHRREGRIEHRQFADFPAYVAAGDVVVANNSRVIPARLEGVKVPGGGRVEVLLVRREETSVWRVLIKGRVSPGQRISFDGNGSGEVLDPDTYGRARIRLNPDDSEWLERAGSVPLPPYIAKIRRAGERFGEDRLRYQTVYATVDGSVAAPTAGLHFTDRVLDGLTSRGAKWVTVTLHVGPGTFEPVRTAAVADHRMAMEWSEVGDDVAVSLNRAIESGGRRIAVGTTAARAVEAAASSGQVHAFSGDTDLFIRPGYQWRAVNGLLTNFHLPCSTPLLMASALCGRSVLFDLYREAAAEGYRFYSYGDAMLIL